MTIARTPYCTKVRYGITGAPPLTEDEMDGTYAPDVSVAPNLIEFIYGEARDDNPAYVSASVTGEWKCFGQRDGGQVTVHFKDGTDNWPVWLAEEARLHDPAADRSPDVADPNHQQLQASARRALDALAALILNTPNPGAEALAAQYELRQALREVTPALSADRIWQIQVQRNNGSWIDHSPATIDGSEAHADFEETVASSGHLWSYRLVCSVRTHTIDAQHDRPEGA